MLKKFDETERLKAVNSYKIEDTLTEKEYDDIAFLASEICGTPIALVTLLYKDRQWFKAAVGTDLKENKRELSFCTHAIAGEEDVMVVENATEDVRFMHNPLVQGGPQLVFYAGASIVNKNGYSIGTVCVYDVVEKSLNNNQIKGLKILSEQVMGLLELREQNSRLEDSIHEKVEVHKLIEESETKFRNLILQSPVLISTFKGPSFIVETINKKALELWGKSYEQVINKPIFEVSPELEEGLKIIFQNIYTSGEPFISNEIPVQLNRTGKADTVYFNSVYQPLRDLDNKIYGIIVIGTEVTETVNARKQIEASEQRFGAAVEAVQGILWTNNAKGEMQGEQKGWAALTGQSYDEYQGYGWANVVHPDDAQPTIEAWNEAVKEFKNFVFEHRVKTKSGEWELFSIKAVPLLNEDGSVREWIGVHTNITEQKKAEEKIKESESIFRTLSETIPHMIWTATHDGKKNFFNQYFLDYTGLSIEELNGDGWQESIFPDDLKKELEQWQNALKTGEDFRFEKRIRKFNGTYRWHLSHSIAQKNKQGNILGWIGTNTDIEEEKKITEALTKGEEQFRTFANSIQNLAWIANADGWIYWYNQRWYDYTGTTFEEMQGWGWDKVHHPDHLKEVIDFVTEGWKRDEAFELTFPLRRHDGAFRRFFTRAYPVKDASGNIERWIGTNTDIDDQLKALEQKDEFMSIASHEMKTPLTAAKAYLQLLEMSLDDSNLQVKSYAKKANHSIERLNQLIVELLDVSKIQEGKINYNFVPFDFNELINDTVEDLQHSSPKHSIINTGKINSFVTGDKDRLQQVVLNLLSNAIKYSPDSKDVCINIEEAASEVKVSIKDKGIGMNKQHLQKIFDRYYRVEEGGTKFQGLGIGLYISNEIIQRHQGKMWAESEPGKGSTFYFTIPI